MDTNTSKPNTGNLPTYTPTPKSSWIEGVGYHATSNHAGFLSIFRRDGGAWLYGEVPSWVPGILTAGIPLDGGHSTGRAFHKVVRGKFLQQEVSKEDAKYLREVFFSVNTDSTN